MTDKLLVKDLVKVFGRRSEDALDLLSNGWSRDDIYRKTQSTIAVQDANFSVREGEIFVVMGLSGSGKSTLSYEERREGKECLNTCRLGLWAYHKKKNKR